MKLKEKVHPEYPFLRSEIIYAIRQEMAVKPNDILCRRMPLGILNTAAAI
jgi:glycerol-3-phosphate dehydrogenase